MAYVLDGHSDIRHGLLDHLQDRRTSGLYRQRHVVDSPQGPVIVVDGKQLLQFCSNDYLGLAAHPQVREAFIQGVRRYGAGSGASHLVNGHLRPHHELEKALAEFTGRESALLFSSGYLANIGVITALLGPGDAVFHDRLNHASLLDGGLLSRARLQRFAHADPDALGRKLAKCRSARRLVVTDGVFSMDGDLAPLARLAEVCAQYGAWLMVDDAHGIGVLGRHGAGSAAELGHEQVPVLMGTLGKAFGVAGAFVAGDRY